MNRLLVSIVLALCGPALGSAQAPATKPRPLAPTYGSNPAAGHTFTHDGLTLYYEVYGAGEPPLIVHGNGGSIADVREQIAYFRTHYLATGVGLRGDEGAVRDDAKPTGRPRGAECGPRALSVTRRRGSSS